MKKFLALLLAAAMIFSFAACTSSEPAAEPAEGEEQTAEGGEEQAASSLDNSAMFVVGTGGTGGTFNAVGALMANFLNDKGFGQFSAMATTGGVQNCIFMMNGDADFGMVSRSTFVESSTGRNTFESVGPSDHLRAIAPLYAAIYQQFVSSDINDFEELKGKTISVGGPGSGDEAFAHVFFEGICGWEFDKDFKPAYLGSAESADAIRDGHAQAMTCLAQAPFSVMIEVVNAGKAKIIPVPQKYIDAICEKGDDPYASYIPGTIPANTFKGQPDEIPSFSAATIFGCSAEVDEEVVYEVTKYIWENIDELTPLHAALAEMKIEDVKDIADLPLHPGALRYYQEVGIL